MALRKIKLNVEVERLLRNDKRCRRDANWLSYKILNIVAKINGKKIFIPYDLWEVFPTFESIARCKRDIMNKENKFNEEFIAEENVTYESPKERKKEIENN